MKTLEKKSKINVAIVISMVSLVISFLTSFLFTKFLLGQPQIGSENYGLKTTVDSLVSFVTIFTFGMSSTFIKFHKKYKDDEASLFSSFNLITTIVGIFALLVGIIFLILTFNGLIIKVGENAYTQEQLDDFILILIISISYISLSIVFGNNKWFLESNKHIIVVRIVNLLVLIAYPVISIPLVLAGANMVVVTLVYSSVYLLGFIFYLFLRIFKYKDLNFFNYKNIKKDLVKEIAVFSIFVILTVCVETFNYSIDKIILTTVFNAATLTTVYQLSVTLNQAVLSLSDMIYAPYLPYLAEDIENKNQNEVQRTYDKVTFILLFISFFVLAGFIGSGESFVNLWVGNEIASDEFPLVYYFSIIIFATWPLYGMARFSTLIHRMAGKHKMSALVYVSSFLLHIIITFTLMPVIGIWSCVLGTALSMLYTGLVFVVINKKLLEINQKKYFINFAKLFSIFAVSVAGVLLIAHFGKFNELFSNLLSFLLKGLIVVIIFLVLFVVVYSKQLRVIFKTYIEKKKGK